MANNEKTGFRDQKYGEWHRSLPHNHLMSDLDTLDLLESTCFGIFSGVDEDGDDVTKFLFECKEIQYSGSHYYLPRIDKNQAGCLRSLCKRYDKNGTRNDIPFFIVLYSIDKEKDERWFVVHAMNDACSDKLKEFYERDEKTFCMTEKGYISFLSKMIGKNIYRTGSCWSPKSSLIIDTNFKNSIV